MARILRLAVVLAISTMLLYITGPNAATQTQSQTGELTPLQKAKLAEAQIVSVNVRRVAQILKQENIALEASLLFTRQGREKLRPQLTSYPDTNRSRVLSGPLRGVLMGDSITLPETSQLEADTVLIANQVIFTGRGPTIKGPHDLHLFALDSINVENGPDTVVTIDTSGSRGVDGKSGALGTSGENGSDGPDGEPGSCQKVKVGGEGAPGAEGLTGGTGGPGTGTDGTDAGNQTIMFPRSNGGVLHLIAIGGMGGAGGDGGNGGKGATIVFSVPPNSANGAMTIDGSGNGHASSLPNKGMTVVSRAGAGGRTGSGGGGGLPGSPSQPGAGGSGGKLVGCGQARGGPGGAGGGGGGGGGGKPGEPGKPGAPGAIANTLL